MNEQHRIDGTLECRDATGSPGRLVGVVLPVGRVAGDRPELFVGSGVQTPREGIALLPEHRSVRLSSCALTRFVVTMASYEWTTCCLTRLKVLALAASVRSGATTGLSPSSFIQLDEARVSGVREVRQSLITAVATVPRQAYDQARAEVRSK